MSGLRREFGVAPRTGVAISALLACAMAAVASFAAQGFPVVPRVALVGLATLFAFAYCFLVAYIYGDARRRGMRHVLWTVMAALVPHALGFIAYFLLREPLLPPCPACGSGGRRGFAFCTHCGAQVAARACAACRRPLDPEWSHCANCGAPVGDPVGSRP
jgi:hypothetical protein